MRYVFYYYLRIGATRRVFNLKWTLNDTNPNAGYTIQSTCYITRICRFVTPQIVVIHGYT